jgi:glutamine cyclotransferase
MNLITKKKKIKWIFYVGLVVTILGFISWVLIRIFAKPPQVTSSLPAVLEPLMAYEVIAEYPHDPQAFTQGLIYLDGFFYESTGLYGESSLRKVEIESGAVLQQFDLSPDYFAEGLTNWEGLLIQLTWREKKGFVYALENFSLLRDFNYPTEGWGLTHDGERLIMSDGSSTLYFLDPESFQVLDQVMVINRGERVIRINELEFVRGEIYANIWQTDTIIRIDPLTGVVQGEIDLSGILPPSDRSSGTDVLNGIAYDPEEDRLFITGKFWPKVFEIRLVPVE